MNIPRAHSSLVQSHETKSSSRLLTQSGTKKHSCSLPKVTSRTPRRLRPTLAPVQKCGHKAFQAGVGVWPRSHPMTRPRRAPGFVPKQSHQTAQHRFLQRVWCGIRVPKRCALIYVRQYQGRSADEMRRDAQGRAGCRFAQHRCVARQESHKRCRRSRTC